MRIGGVGFHFGTLNIGGGTVTGPGPLNTDPAFIDPVLGLASTFPDHLVGTQRMFVPSAAAAINAVTGTVTLDQAGATRGTGNHTLGALEINYKTMITVY